MKPLNPSNLSDSSFSRYVPRAPADYPVRIRLAESQRARLAQLCGVLVPPSRGHSPGGVAELIRRAIDYALSRPTAWLTAKPSGEPLEAVVAVRLTREQVERLDSIGDDEANLEAIGTLMDAEARSGPVSFRSVLVRAAIDLYLQQAPEVKKAGKGEKK